MNRSRILGTIACLALIALGTPASIREFRRIYLAPIQAGTYWDISVPVDSRDQRRLQTTVNETATAIERAVNNANGKPCVIEVAVRRGQP